MKAKKIVKKKKDATEKGTQRFENSIIIKIYLHRYQLNAFLRINLCVYARI